MTRLAVAALAVAALLLVRGLGRTPRASTPPDEWDLDWLAEFSKARYLYNPATGVSVSHN